MSGIAATSSRVRADRLLAVAAALLCGATLAARWPGVAMYDTISQYEQATSGDVFDWHPPVMARLWSLLAPLWPGTPPMLLLQVGLWWGGLGLLAAALARRGGAVAGAAVLAIGAWPLFVGWDTVVLKDAQLASCLVAAVGLTAWWRLDGRPVPRPAIAAIVLLFVYATLVRGNAVFATVPLGLALSAWPRGAGRWGRVAVLLGSIVAVLVASPLVNRHLLAARSSKVERALPLYDVAGIVHHAGLATIGAAARGEWAESERRGCYTPYFWNPYGMPSQCEALGDHVAFDADGGAPLIRLWVRLVTAHPIAWGEHRLRHFNSNVRFLVGRHEADAGPPVASEANDLGLGGPANAAGRLMATAADWIAATPLGWPFAWLGVAVTLLWAGETAPGPAAALGRALAGSAAVMSASYAVVSIASDLRYHLWSMEAAALACVLFAGAGGLDRARLRIGAASVAALCVAAIVARVALPPEPNPYPVDGRLSGAVAATAA